MSKNKVVLQFNTTLDEFIYKLILAFPTEIKLKAYYRAFKITSLYDETLPLHMFMGGCIKYGDQIKQRDEEFFIKKTKFIDKCLECSTFSNDIGIIDHWEKMTDKTKQSIWEYVQTLFVLGDLFINKDPNLLNQTNIIYQGMTEKEFSRFQNIDVKELSSDFLQKIK